MFGSKKTIDSMNSDKVQTVVGEGTEIKGTITSTGVIRIDGRLEGSIDHNGDLIIGPKGNLVANIRATGMAVAGEVRGQIDVEAKLELLPGSRLFGDIRCGHLVVHEGAMFHGRSLMSPEGAGSSPAQSE